MKYEELNKINSKNVTCCRNTAKSKEIRHTKSKKMKYFIDHDVKICYFINVLTNNCKKGERLHVK